MKTEIKTTVKTIEQLKLFPNLFNALCSEININANEIKEGIKLHTELKNFDTWYYKRLLPKSKSISDFKTVDEIKSYLFKRIDKNTAKKIDENLNHLLLVEAANDFKYFNISVEWKRSKMWGSNPTASGYDYNGSYSSGSISGCGYDKLSTAVADVLNQSLALKKALYLVRERDLTTSLHDLFGYGSGNRLLPYF